MLDAGPDGRHPGLVFVQGMTLPCGEVIGSEDAVYFAAIKWSLQQHSTPILGVWHCKACHIPSVFSDRKRPNSHIYVLESEKTFSHANMKRKLTLDLR